MAFPIYDFDLFSDSGIAQPYEHYTNIRELGPVVALPATNVLAVGRYSDVRQSLLNHRQFVSGQGIALNSAINEAGRGTTLMSDEPLHQRLRSVIATPLGPSAVAQLRQQIQQAADELIERLTRAGTFDAMHDLAAFLPLSIVSNLVGLPRSGRENMLAWASATFDGIGPANARLDSALPVVREMIAYVAKEAGPGQVAPGSWAARVYEAAEQGQVSFEQATFLILDYLGPSLDTTIFATGHMLKLFGQHPDQWELLRSDPAALIPNAVNEVVRLESPIRGFSRVALNECLIDGITVPSGSRLLMLYASANRDERKWADPNRFDIKRERVQDQLGFGFGRHICAGQHLARLEIECLLRAMSNHFVTISAGEPVLQPNNILRGYSSLPMRVN